MAISSAGTSLFLFVIATYTYLNKSDYDLSKFSWVPVVSLSLVIFLASLGIISLPFIIITELLPAKVSIMSFFYKKFLNSFDFPHR